MRKNDVDLTSSQATDLAHYFLGPEWAANYARDQSYQLVVGSPPYDNTRFWEASSWRAVFRKVGIHLPLRPRFVAHEARVMQGDKCVAVACSGTFAKRTANALNEYEPNRRGL